MKKELLLLLTILFMVAIPTWAADEPVTYEVTIQVTYNELSPEQASAIVKETLSKHRGCV